SLVTERPIPVATLVVALTILAATPISRIKWTTVDASSLPASAQAFQANRAINRSHEFVRNGGTPFYLAVQAPPTAAAAAAALAHRAHDLDGVLAVAAPRFLGSNTWQINLIATEPPYSTTTQRLVGRLRTLESPYPLFVGGDAAAFHDERSAIGAHLPLATALPATAAATLSTLCLPCGCVVAPLPSPLMTAPPLAAAFGALILIFQDGRFEGLLGYTSQGAVDLTIPLVLAAIVFAISTDYGVFLLSRV